MSLLLDKIESLLRVPTQKCDIFWAHEVCTVSRLLHWIVWSHHPEYEYVAYTVLPLLSKAANAIELLRVSGRHDKATNESLLARRRNVEVRIRNLQTNFLAGYPSDFIPEDRVGKLAATTLVPVKVARKRKPHPKKVPPAGKRPRRKLSRNGTRAYDYSKMEWHSPTVPDFRELPINGIGKEPQADIVLMTATEIELLQVLHCMKPLRPRRKILIIPDGYETYYFGRFGRFTTAVVRCGMGSGGPNAASHTARSAIERWKPSALILAGIAFGRSPEKHLPGDVLIAEQIVPYEKQRVGEKAIFREAIPLTGLTLINRFTNALAWTFARPDGSIVTRHYGRLLSGEKLIDDPAYKKELMDQFPDAIGGEMEAAGACAAAIRGKVEWIAVKAVSDWADGKKHDGYQEMAAAASVSLVHHVLSFKYALEGLA